MVRSCKMQCGVQWLQNRCLVPLLIQTHWQSNKTEKRIHARLPLTLLVNTGGFKYLLRSTNTPHACTYTCTCTCMLVQYKHAEVSGSNPEACRHLHGNSYSPTIDHSSLQTVPTSLFRVWCVLWLLFAPRLRWWSSVVVLTGYWGSVSTRPAWCRRWMELQRASVFRQAPGSCRCVHRPVCVTL